MKNYGVGVVGRCVLHRWFFTRRSHKALMARGFRLSRLAAPAHIAVENAW